MRIAIPPPSIPQFLLWLSILACLHSAAVAQDARQQIERDVWIPLLAASNAFAAEGFLAVQSPDLVRVAADANEVYGLSRYAAEIRAGFERARARGMARESDVRFLVRTASADLAYETGYFRSRATLPDGTARIRYSRFEFVLRREEGRWRILLDKDTADGGKITEADFLAATPLTKAPTEP